MNKGFDLSPAHGSRDGLPSSILAVDRCILGLSLVESAFGIPAVDPELPAPSLGSHLVPDAA